MKTPSRKIDILIIALLKHLSSTVAKVPVKFQSNYTSLNANLAASRLCEILQ